MKITLLFLLAAMSGCAERNDCEVSAIKSPVYSYRNDCEDRFVEYKFQKFTISLPGNDWVISKLNETQDAYEFSKKFMKSSGRYPNIVSLAAERKFKLRIMPDTVKCACSADIYVTEYKNGLTYLKTIEYVQREVKYHAGSIKIMFGNGYLIDSHDIFRTELGDTMINLIIESIRENTVPTD